MMAIARLLTIFITDAKTRFYFIKKAEDIYFMTQIEELEIPFKYTSFSGYRLFIQRWVYI